MSWKYAVSIIIPVYNAEKYIKKCLNSILNQTFKNYEVIIVDDGSTDNSQQIIKRYVERFPSKFKILAKENGGQSSARNMALPIVNGEYVTFLDSDDYYDRRYLAILYKTAKRYDSDMVISGQKKVDETGKIYMHIDYPTKKYPKCIMRRLNFSGKLYRTEYLRKHNMQFAEGKTYEDNPFNLKMIFLARNLVILPYSGYYQVGHPGSTTTKKIIEEKLPYEELEEAIKYVLQRREELNDYEVFEYTVLSFFTYFIFQANKKHMYLNIEDRKSDILVIAHLCDYVASLLETYFPQYWKNKYIGFFKGQGLEWKQRVGVWVFVNLAHMKLLKKFALLYYRF